MGKTFIEEFDAACRRLSEGSPHMRTETDRVHQETVRDPNHAFRDVDIPKPVPLRNRTGLTI